MRAKRPLNALAGPYGHPFHPILVTIPIGTWTASLVFDILGLFAEDAEAYVVGAQVLIAIGDHRRSAGRRVGIHGLPAARGRARRRVEPERSTWSLNLGAVVLFAINYFVRAGSDHDDVSIVGLVLTVIGLAALGASGWLGGKLAYHYGVRVAAEDTQREGFS